jgi:hypothetical protein
MAGSWAGAFPGTLLLTRAMDGPLPTYCQVCVREVKELPPEFVRRRSLAFDRLSTYEVDRSNVNHPWLLEFHRQRL